MEKITFIQVLALQCQLRWLFFAVACCLERRICHIPLWFLFLKTILDGKLSSATKVKERDSETNATSNRFHGFAEENNNRESKYRDVIQGRDRYTRSLVLRYRQSTGFKIVVVLRIIQSLPLCSLRIRVSSRHFFFSFPLFPLSHFLSLSSSFHPIPVPASFPLSHSRISMPPFLFSYAVRKSRGHVYTLLFSRSRNLPIFFYLPRVDGDP